MAIALVASWLTMGLLLLCPVIHNPVSFGHTVQNAHPLYHGAVNNAHQALRRTVTTVDEIQRNLDIAIVKDYVQRKWQESISKGEIKETVQTTGGEIGKHVRFETVGDIRLKEAFHFMQYYPLLSGGETNPTYFEVPIGTEYQKFKLTNKAGGKFSISAEHTTSGGLSNYVDLSDLSSAVGALDDSKLKLPLRTTLEEVTIGSLDEKLASQPDLQQKLTTHDSGNTVTNQERDEAFQAAKDVLADSSVLRKDLTGLNPATWLVDVKTNVDQRMDGVARDLSKNLASEEKTKLKFEFAQSMLSSATDAEKEWERLKKLTTVDNAGQVKPIIEERRVGRDKHLVVTIHENDQVSLKEIFKLLQFYNDLYPKQKTFHTHFEVPIGGETRTFRLHKSKESRGKHQIAVLTDDRAWPGTTPNTPKPGKRYNPLVAPDYDTMIDEILVHADHNELAKAMQDALDNKLNSKDQPSFDKRIKAGAQNSPDTVRAAVEFMLISMIAEAAQPPEELKARFLTDVLSKIRDKNRFPEGHELPNLAKIDDKAGRSPAMDQVVEGMLEDVTAIRKIDTIFTKAEFPARIKSGGTQKGRKFIHKESNRDVPSYMIRKRAADDHDGDVILRKVARLCTDKRRRRRRSVCRLTDKDSINVDEESIKVTDKMVELDVVDRRDSKLREHVEFPLSSDELATPKLIKDNIAKSRRSGASKTYAKINKGLAVHGLIFSVLGAADYFNKGDYVRGSISLTQAVHTFGGLTGLNEVVSKVGKRVLSSAAKGLAKGLNFERGLERFSSKMERFMEKGVGN